MSNRRDKIGIVIKLMKLGHNNSNENEAKLALKKAQELIDKYQITKEEVLNVAGGNGERPRVRVQPERQYVVINISMNQTWGGFSGGTGATSTSSGWYTCS